MIIGNFNVNTLDELSNLSIDSQTCINLFQLITIENLNM